MQRIVPSRGLSPRKHTGDVMNDNSEFSALRFDQPGRGRIYDSIVETMGNTPLVRVRRLCAAEGIKADVLLKLEFFNPLASVKDRIGVNMILALEQQGKIKPGVDPDRADVGQYGDRAGIRGRGARLSRDPDDAGFDVD